MIQISRVRPRLDLQSMDGSRRFLSDQEDRGLSFSLRYDGRRAPPGASRHRNRLQVVCFAEQEAAQDFACGRAKQSFSNAAMSKHELALWPARPETGTRQVPRGTRHRSENN